MYLKKSIYLGIVFILAVTALVFSAPRQCSAAAQAGASDARSVSEIVEKVKPALVMINVVAVEFRQGRDIKQEAVGSGVIISPDGYVITNHHVAGHAKSISCTLSDKTDVRAELVGSDPLSDIAVLKLAPGKKKYPCVPFGDSDKLRIGERVLAMGSPLAFSQSVTMGIVSIKDLVFPDIFRGMELTLDGEEVGSIVLWIGHDAQIFPGNSGGPLIDMKGEIVGINEIKVGLSGAIPGNLAKSVAEQLIRHQRVKRSWLGFIVQPMLKSADRTTGVFISDTVEGSPARKAGFQPGDILLAIDGRACTVRFFEDIPAFNQELLSLPEGREVRAQVLRGSTEMTLPVTPIDRDLAKAREREFGQWGICASNITFFTAKALERPGTEGIIVTSVRPGGPAESAKPSIAANDIIMAINGAPVRDIAEFTRLTKEACAGKKEPVPVLVAFERFEDLYITVVNLGVPDVRDAGMEVRKAWLPVNVQAITPEIAEALGFGDTTGVRITRVYPGRSAEKAKLQVGDFIVALDGQGIPASQPEDVEVFSTMIRQYRIGSTADLSVIREGKKMTVAVTLEETPRLPREMKRYRDNNFDFIVRDLTFADCTEQDWAETQRGALVESVGEGGWASLGRLMRGDLIVKVDGKAVENTAAFEKLMEQTAAAKQKYTILEVLRGSTKAFIELEPLWSSN